MIHNEEGPPCRHMEPLLQAAADDSARGLKRWYALNHAARCGRCNRFLARLRETIARLRQTKQEDPAPEALTRLAAGPWRNTPGETPPQP